MLPSPKAFEGPRSYEERRGTRWQNRGCSSSEDRSIGSRCGRTAFWMIARSPEQIRGVRFACDQCKRKKYGKLEEVRL